VAVAVVLEELMLILAELLVAQVARRVVSQAIQAQAVLAVLARQLLV
jgi:hypothetical protein